MKAKKNTVQTVTELLTPVAEALGLKLWDVEYVREAGEMRLKITIDKDGGVGIEDCESFQRVSDPVIDEADPIAEPYIMEVSSPGLERDIKYGWHIDACAGQRVTVKLYTSYDGTKSYTGILQPDRESTVGLVLDNGDNVEFDKKSVAKINMYFDFKDLK